jgi:hypothetical protein
MTQTLETAGFLFTENAGDWATLAAEFGDGHESAKLSGDSEGTRLWSIRIDALPDETNQVSGVVFDPGFLKLENGGFFKLQSGGKIVLDTTISRAQYLWRFFKQSKSSGDAPFWIEVEDQKDGQRKRYLASFVDHKLTYTVLCAKLYSTGMQLRQRRLSGVTSPIVV